MASLKVFVVDALTDRIEETATWPIPDSDLDSMQDHARMMLENAKYHVRALNISIDRNLIAYVYKEGTRPKPPEPLKGWVFRRSSITSHS